MKDYETNLVNAGLTGFPVPLITAKRIAEWLLGRLGNNFAVTFEKDTVILWLSRNSMTTIIGHPHYITPKCQFQTLIDDIRIFLNIKNEENNEQQILN